MAHGCDERFGNIGASDALAHRERRLHLPDTNGTLIGWPVEKKGSSDNGVGEPAGSDRVFRTASPEDGIAFPDIQTEDEQGFPRDTDGRHIHEASPEVVSTSCINGVEDPFVLSRPYDGLMSKTRASNAGGEDQMAHTRKRGNECLPHGNIPRNDLGVRAQAL